jgi:hypothetical protein
MANSNKNIKKLTARQLLAIDYWIQDGKKSKAKALRQAGYEECVATQPDKVFGSPAVIEEFAKRGLDSQGFRYIQKSKEVKEEPPRLQIDLSKLTKDDLIELKEKLANAPDIEFMPSLSSYQKPRVEPKEEFDHSYTPTGRGVDVFSEEAQYTEKRFDNFPSFSSI